jgi:hypothetical protein
MWNRTRGQVVSTLVPLTDALSDYPTRSPMAMLIR